VTARELLRVVELPPPQPPPQQQQQQQQPRCRVAVQ